MAARFTARQLGRDDKPFAAITRISAIRLFNVANHLRQGFGGQDVEMLPVPILPITNPP